MEVSPFGPRIAVRPANWTLTLKGFLTPRRMTLAFCLLMVLCALPQTVNHFRGGLSKDYPLWYETGQKVIAGKQLYPVGESFPFMYPPIAAILLAPLSLFGPFSMMLILNVINSVFWFGCVVMSVYLITGKAFQQNPLLYLLPALCSAPFAFDTYHLGQVNLILLGIMLGAFVCLRRRYEWGAGALVALAAGIKAFPLMAVGYFVYRRHWTALLSLVASLLVFFIAVPFAVRGPDQGADDVTVWASGMLFKYDSGSIGQRTDRAYSWKNQSLLGLSNRLLRHKSADDASGNEFYVNVADLDFRTVNVIVLGIALSLCLFYIGVMPAHPKRTPQSDTLEFAMLLLMILLFSPYTFGYFYVWLLFPFAVLVNLGLTALQSSPESRRFVVVFVAAVGLCALSLIEKRTAEAYGNFFAATLLLLVTFGLQLNKLKRASNEPSPTLPPQTA